MTVDSREDANIAKGKPESTRFFASFEASRALVITLSVRSQRFRSLIHGKIERPVR